MTRFIIFEGNSIGKCLIIFINWGKEFFDNTIELFMKANRGLMLYETNEFVIRLIIS